MPPIVSCFTIRVTGTNDICIDEHGHLRVIPVEDSARVETMSGAEVREFRSKHSEEFLQEFADNVKDVFKLSSGKAGKPIDPNSARQKVLAGVPNIISAQGPMPGWKVRLELKKMHPELNEKQIYDYANQVKGILRDGNNWSLKEAA